MEPGAVTTLAVTVKSPATIHEVSIRQLEQWMAKSATGLQDIMSVWSGTRRLVFGPNRFLGYPVFQFHGRIIPCDCHLL